MGPRPFHGMGLWSEMLLDRDIFDRFAVPRQSNNYTVDLDNGPTPLPSAAPIARQFRSYFCFSLFPNDDLPEKTVL